MIGKNISLYIISTFTFLPCLAMDPHMAPPVQRTYPLDFQPMKLAHDPDDEKIITPRPITITDSTLPTFEGIHIQDLETVFNAAPQKAQFIVSLLTDQQLYQKFNHRSSFLLSNHGYGKTVLAKALAYKICSTSEWTYEYISSREFVGEYRHQTGVCLRSYLAKVEALQHPTILIIDQLNKILDYPDSASDDTSFASDLICNFLDKNKYNKKLFFLGIMDRVTELDERLKSRLLMSIIKLKEPTDPELKRIIFTSKCTTDSIRLHPEVTNAWLSTLLTNAPTITGRNFRCLAIELHNKLVQNTFNCSWIGKRDLQKALTHYLEAQKDVHHVDPYEAHIDKLERLHQEHRARQRQLQEEYIRNMEQTFLLRTRLLAFNLHNYQPSHKKSEAT